MTSDKAEEGEGEELKEKIDGIRGSLEGDPRKLRNKDVEDVICYLDVEEIICLSLNSDQGRKRFNDDKEARPAKGRMWKARRVQRNLGGKNEKKENRRDNQKKLRYKDLEDVIYYLDVNEIISLAFNNGRRYKARTKLYSFQ